MSKKSLFRKLVWSAPFLLAITIAETRTTAQIAQPAATTANLQPHNVPLSVLYREFLAYQAHLDQLAGDLDKKGKDSSEVRNYLQRQVGLTDTQFALVRQSGTALGETLKQQDAKAKVIIDAIHAKYPPGQPGVGIPPVPPELTQLQEQRKSMIEAEVANLKVRLGPEASARLDAFLTQKFARNVTVSTVHIPGPNNPAQHPLPPFPTAVKQ